MTDGQWLYLVLCLLYASECFVLVGRGTVAFVSPWGGRSRAVFASATFGTRNAGAVFLNPLPPMGSLFLAHLPAIAISPEGVCSTSGQSIGPVRVRTTVARSLAFDEIEKVEAVEAELRVNGARFARFASAGLARAAAALLEALVAAPQAGRARLIAEFMDGQFDVERAAARLKECGERGDRLRETGIAFVVFLFVVLPVAAHFIGLRALAIPGALLLVGYAGLLTAQFWRAHKAVYPADSGERAGRAFRMILCPPIAIRACDAITSASLEEFSPFVVTQLLCGTEDRSFARAFVRELLHPLAHEFADDRSAGIVAWFRTRQLARCKGVCDALDANAWQRLMVPPEQEAGCTHFCPRCDGQFTGEMAMCPDCVGVAVMAFESAAKLEAVDGMGGRNSRKRQKGKPRQRR